MLSTWIGSDQNDYNGKLKIFFLNSLRCLLLRSSVFIAWEILLLCFDRLCFALKWMEIIFILQKTEYVDGKTTPPGPIERGKNGTTL